tara:strand:- start:367 stop:816 length:450 start_codon:yes stop_codon:yes gene_type:complete
MKTKNFTLAFIFNILIYGASLAETIEEKMAKYVLLNMQQDYITCYAFYKIGAEYIKQSNGEQKIIEGVEKSSDISLKFAHETGELMGMETEQMSSKVELEMKVQLDLIDNDFNKASILLEKYAQQCKSVIENKKQRISLWEEKAKIKFQ